MVPLVFGSSSDGASNLCLVAVGAGQMARSIARTAAWIGIASRQQLTGFQNEGASAGGCWGNGEWIAEVTGGDM